MYNAIYIAYIRFIPYVRGDCTGLRYVEKLAVFNIEQQVHVKLTNSWLWLICTYYLKVKNFIIIHEMILEKKY